MVRRSLQPHPATPARTVTGVSCALAEREPRRWTVEFEVADPVGALVLPEPRAPGRADELWKTTCFEVFLRRPGEGAYIEFNLSPSGAWAVYAFDGYRQGMADLEAAPPLIERPQMVDGTCRVEASLDTAGLGPGPWLASLSAVIEEAGGLKSYWALAHGSDKPDFHHPDSFVLELA